MLLKIKYVKTKLGSNNPNSRAVKAKHVDTGKNYFLIQLLNVKLILVKKHHRFITTRVKKETRSLYKGVWNIAYKDDDYLLYATRKVVRKK